MNSVSSAARLKVLGMTGPDNELRQIIRTMEYIGGGREGYSCAGRPQASQGENMNDAKETELLAIGVEVVLRC